ncbi:hypothetical protein [Lichenifustis flavocetrariae]|uniref:Uncharacterized protein n=1 Tax=Lichenifustis flavocetrariae TaxID=2949735 RepID=A0AA41Z949_9HYPH|nr:hypothetical protein [Lichenifustis flavocetrariae]MCW6511607.1 hypothetical protein [Lichenifustis flavocetrariae]
MLNITRCRSILTAFGIALGSTGALSANAAELVIDPLGTNGLSPIPFNARNSGTEPIDCQIAAAHFYSVDLGTAAPGGEVKAELWASVATGEVYVLNRTRVRIPVQSLWCGFAGRAWETRDPVELARKAGHTPGPITLMCQGETDRLRCR